MEGLPLDVSPLGDEGAQMITLVETSALEEEGHQPPNVHILTAHQVANVPRYTVLPPARSEPIVLPPTRSEPITCLFGRDVSPTVPPAFLLDT
ncbi:hypothetical protein E2C01_068687 [Portunus trituberculatus]|uniref:Uncharacterized protein n=1 Tax=Portunus trituberculatus TaxID=210409 RepID=A0A5B7HPG3_PORTR|nr:hypothetical protein [Portunus trituberculatus]